MSEGKDNDVKQNLTKLMKSRDAKRYLLIFSLVVAVILMLFLSPGKEPVVESKLNANPPRVSATNEDQPSQEFKTRVGEYNRLESEKAAASGKSFMAIPMTEPAVSQAPAPTDYSKAPVQQTINSAPQTHQQTQQRSQERAMEYQKLLAQFNRVPTAQAYVLASQQAADQQKALANHSTNSASQSAPVVAKATSKKVLVEALSDGYAQTIDAVDTDGSPVARARIVGGPLDGAVINGEVSMVQESIQWKFRTLSWNSKTYPVEIYGVDEATRSSLISGNLDRRLWERYGFPFVANVFGVSGQLIAQSGATQNNTFGVSQTTYPVLSGEKIAMSAVGQSFGRIGNDLRSAGQGIKAHVQLPANSGIGIVFMKEFVVEQ